MLVLSFVGRSFRYQSLNREQESLLKRTLEHFTNCKICHAWVVMLHKGREEAVGQDSRTSECSDNGMIRVKMVR